MRVEVLDRGFKMDEFVSKAELAQSFQRYEPIQKLLMKFRVRDKSCEILKVKENLLSLIGVKRTEGSNMFGSFFCLTTITQRSRKIRNSKSWIIPDSSKICQYSC